MEDRGPEAGVIAQEVAEVFPELVDEDPESGYLRVDYGGLADRIAAAVRELAGRAAQVEGLSRQPSDERLKRSPAPVQDALARLESGERLSGGDGTALVAVLIEAVKELDERLTQIEGRLPER